MANSEINRGPHSKRLMRSTVDLISARTCVTHELNLLFWILDVAYFRKKNEVITYALVGPVKNMMIQKHVPRHKLTNYTITE